MSALKQIQKTVLKNIIQSSESNSNKLQSIIAPTDQWQRRLAVYQQGYIARLINSINSDFAVSRKLLGPKRFDAKICDYLEAHPSTSHFINEAARGLPEFFAHQKPAIPKIVGEMLRLEWLMILSFYDYYNFSEQSAWHNLKNFTGSIAVNPSIYIHKSDYLLAAVWHSGEPQEPLPHTQATVTWTLADRLTRVIDLDCADAQLLFDLKSGVDLGSAITVWDSTKFDTTNKESSLQSMFADWCQVGLLKSHEH